MKKFIFISIVIFGVACAVIAQDSEYTVTVGTNSTIIATPRKNIVPTKGWLPTNAVTQGEILFCNSNGQKYLVLVAGDTSTNAPTFVDGQSDTNGTATLIHCQENIRRTKFLATLESDANVWIKTGLSSSTNSGGEFLCSKGQQYSSTSGEAISAIASSNVKLVIIDQ